MRRTLIGAGIGFVVGVLTIAGIGFWGGLTYGGDWVNRPGMPPGLEPALLGALIAAAYFWSIFGGLGAIMGGLAAFGSWLVSPARPHQLVPAVSPGATRQPPRSVRE